MKGSLLETYGFQLVSIQDCIVNMLWCVFLLWETSDSLCNHIRGMEENIIGLVDTEDEPRIDQVRLHDHASRHGKA